MDNLGDLKRHGLPKISGRIRARALDSSVSVIRDHSGCAHINARTEHDAWFAQGFCHAQDRLWQMERTRRFARGTLSEILGEPLIPVDKNYRRLGIQVVSERDWPQLNDVAQNILEAFTHGVNAAVESMRQLPPEFEVLGIEPERWVPTDSIALWKVIFLTQTSDFNHKIFRAALARKLSPEDFSFVHPYYPGEAPVVCPPGSTGDDLGSEVAELSALAWQLAPLSSPEGGSNNWAVDGSLSASGKPLLAGDPHAVIQIAPVWYMNHLRTPEWEMTGVSTPGVPGILLYGHNGHVGWTVTNAQADIADLFVEKFDEDFRRYLHRGKWLEADIRREEIHVKGRTEPVIEEIPVTVHGPLVSGGPLGTGVPLSWQWLGHRVITTFECIPGMARAKNVDEFRESQRNWVGPPMNRITADDTGNIAYQLIGEIPVRTHNGANSVPVPGWSGEYDWVNVIPFEELPWSRNPERHYLVSANNRTVPAGFPYHVNDLNVVYRAWRIEDLLRGKEQFTIDDFKSMQGDRYSRPAAEFLRIFRNMNLGSNDIESLQLFHGWDCVLSADSAAAALYEVFLQQLFHHVFAFTSDLPGSEIGRVRWQSSYLPQLLQQIDKDDSTILQLNATTRQRTWRDILLETLKEAEEMLRDRLGPDTSRWEWGKLHRQTFVHNLGRTPPYNKLFNIPSVEIGGDASTVFNAGVHYDRDFAVLVGVSFRMIIDFADLDKAVWILPPGQSGHPGSPHYADSIMPWLDVEYRPMIWNWKHVKADQEGTLWLLRERSEADV